MKTVRLDNWGRTLGTRNLGQIVREHLISLMETQNQPIVISFKNILMVSSAFADECFGKLIATIGPRQFKQTFEIRDLDSQIIRKVLNQTVKRRLFLNEVAKMSRVHGKEME